MFFSDATVGLVFLQQAHVFYFIFFKYGKFVFQKDKNVIMAPYMVYCTKLD